MMKPKLPGLEVNLSVTKEKKKKKRKSAQEKSYKQGAPWLIKSRFFPPNEDETTVVSHSGY